MGLPTISVSGDGRFVAFESREGLVPEDVSPAVDIYVLDRATGVVTLETTPFAPTDSHGDSGHPQLSADGRFIVFTSGADLTHTQPTDRFPRIFLRDRERGTLLCLSVGPNGQFPDGSSSEPVISADGNIVAFTSQATNLVAGPDANGSGSDVYVWRRESQTLSRISLGEVQDEGARVMAIYEPSLSGDGQQVAFTVMFDRTESRNSLMERRGVARRKVTRVYVADLRSGIVERVGCSTTGRDACASGRDFRPALSADGHFVAFTSTAPDRVKDDDNSLSDVFLYDRQTHALQIVSRSPSGKSGNEASSSAALSADGHFVSFESRASNLVCERHCSEADADRNLVSDVFLFDRESGAMSRISVGGDGPWWDASVGPAIDARGDVIAFSSGHAMGPQDWRGDFDLFVWARQALTWTIAPTPVALATPDGGTARVRRSYNAPADADAAAADLVRSFRRTCDAAGTPGAAGARTGALGRCRDLEEPWWRAGRAARGDARRAARGPHRGAL